MYLKKLRKIRYIKKNRTTQPKIVNTYKNRDTKMMIPNLINLLIAFLHVFIIQMNVIVFLMKP